MSRLRRILTRLACSRFGPLDCEGSAIALLLTGAARIDTSDSRNAAGAPRLWISSVIQFDGDWLLEIPPELLSHPRGAALFDRHLDEVRQLLRGLAKAEARISRAMKLSGILFGLVLVRFCGAEIFQTGELLMLVLMTAAGMLGGYLLPYLLSKGLRYGLIPLYRRFIDESPHEPLRRLFASAAESASEQALHYRPPG